MLRRWRLGLLLIVFAALAVGATVYYGEPLLTVHHVADRYPHRANTLTANVTGALSPFARSAEYRLNEGDWRPLARGGQRAPDGFLIEIRSDQLRAGKNRVDLRATALLRSSVEEAHEFEYDPSPVRLPVVKTWKDADLEAQDGYWEAIEVDGEWRVRPVPGYEGYDRILTVTGTFAGARRIETNVVFRGRVGGKPYGFGVIPLWAGHPDDKEWTGPRRGWRFAIAWFYNQVGGIGCEFSDKFGPKPYDWVRTTHKYAVEPGAKYRLVVECWSERDGSGKHRRFVQRLKWWKDGSAEPGAWLELADTLGQPLPDGEYSVALVAHRARAEFGPVKVSRLARD